MDQEARRWATRGSRNLAIVLVLSTQVLLAAPGEAPDAEQPASGMGSVAIAPFVFVGRVDEEITRTFNGRLATLKSGPKIVDQASVVSHLRKGVTFRSDAPLPELLKAAKAAGAGVLIVGQASSYKFMDAPGVRLRVKLIAVDSGSEIHRDLAEETAFTLPGAKREAATTAAKKVGKKLLAK